MSGDEPLRSDNPLLALYRRYLGEPESETDVYVGFALFFGGIALSTLGFLVFLWNVTVPRDAALFVQLREVAIALAMVGLPAFVLSIVVLLPVRKYVVYAGAAGAFVCLVGAGVFVTAYPAHWNVPGRVDYSVQGITVYAVGVATLAATTGSALVAHHLQRVGDRATTDGDAAGDADAGRASGTGGDRETGSTVTDGEVEGDIEEAMANSDLTWGGVEKAETRRLQINTDDAGASLDYSGFGPDAAQSSRSGGVDDAVAGLRSLQGSGHETGTSEGVDEQTAALSALRERQATEADDGSVVGRVRDRLGL